MLADHHKIRLLQMRLKQLEVQMRKQYTSEPTGQRPSGYDGPYPRNSTYSTADKKQQAKQERFEELKKQYVDYLQDYNNLMSDIALDSPGDAKRSCLCLLR